MSPNFVPQYGAVSLTPTPLAIQFIRRDGLVFTVYRNPRDISHKYPEVQGSTPTLKGNVMYQWTPDLGQFTISGLVTETGGIQAWVDFQNNFKNRTVRYHNAITGEDIWVSINNVTLTMSNKSPFTSMYAIQCTEAAPIVTSGAVSLPTKGAQ